MKWEEIEPKASSIRSALIRVMNGMLSRRKEWSLAVEDPLFNKSKEKLECPEFNIVICGEVKRGKSTFINALLGKSLLPTGVGETTSQVFHVSNAEKESFALEFADGKRESITRSELVRYGSQTAADLEGEPLFRGRALKWIDVETKAAFLPKGVHLVDTPGLGALYSAHSAITNEYVKQADVVIFILDSSKPLVQSEKEFLQKVFSITPNVLFVQTKIDMKKEAEWLDLLHRNEELLNEAFGEAGKPKIRVYPIASKLLFDAATESIDELREISYSASMFGETKEALDALMYRSVGWSRSAVSATHAYNYHQVVTKYFEEQRKMLASTSEEEKKRITQEKTDIQKQFMRDWNENGVKRLEVKRKVTKILNSVRSRASTIGIPGSVLYKQFQDEVDSASDMNELKSVIKQLPSDMCDSYSEAWNDINQDAISKLEDELQDFAVSASGGELSGCDWSLDSVNESGLYAKIRGTFMGASTGLGLTYFGALLLGVAASGGLLAIAGLIGLFVGGIATKGSELQRAKQEVKGKLGEIAGNIRGKITLPQGNKDSLVDQFVENVSVEIDDALKQMYEFEKARSEQQLQKLEEQAALNVQQSQDALVTLKDRMQLWAGLGTELQAEVVKLRQLQDAFA